MQPLKRERVGRARTREKKRFAVLSRADSFHKEKNGLLENQKPCFFALGTFIMEKHSR